MARFSAGLKNAVATATTLAVGAAIKPGLSLGGYAAFAGYDNSETLLMGDLVVTEGRATKSHRRSPPRRGIRHHSHRVPNHGCISWSTVQHGVREPGSSVDLAPVAGAPQMVTTLTTSDITTAIARVWL
jgi:hypothetical protein